LGNNSDWKAEVGLNLIELESTWRSSYSCGDVGGDEHDTSTVRSDSSDSSSNSGDSEESCAESCDGSAGEGDVDGLTGVTWSEGSTSKIDLDSTPTLSDHELIGTMESLSLHSNAHVIERTRTSTSVLMSSSSRPTGPLIQELD
jgi:hypothetical protein